MGSKVDCRSVTDREPLMDKKRIEAHRSAKLNCFGNAFGTNTRQDMLLHHVQMNQVQNSDDYRRLQTAAGPSYTRNNPLNCLVVWV
mmetsp:Transcript_7488/g.12967  ORF Transcript_7488/g.12967 Transcript_7488/m.12967 type:complete len:86 (+) Transcript_7488:328-585(+)